MIWAILYNNMFTVSKVPLCKKRAPASLHLAQFLIETANFTVTYFLMIQQVQVLVISERVHCTQRFQVSPIQE